MSQTIHVSNGRVHRHDDGIIDVIWDDDVSVEEGDIQEVLDAELTLMDDRAVVLVDARRVRSMTRAAQRMTTDHPVAEQTDAVAILTDGPVSRMLGNFFLAIMRPRYPTRLFGDEDEARAWLRSRCG